MTPVGPRWPGAARTAVLVVSALLLARGVTAPFLGWHDLNSAMYSQFARNHVQYGLAYTKLYCTWGDTATPPATPERYLNHPPLIALWTAVPLAVFGDHEWAARLVPIAASLGSVALLMRIVGRLGGPLLGALAGFFFATLPLTVYFGRMIDHVAPVQFFTLFMLDGYLEWARVYPGEGRPRLGALRYATGAVLGIGTGWGAVLPAALLCAWHALRVARGRGEVRTLAGLVAAPAASLAAVVLHILAGCGFDLGMLRDLFLGHGLGGEGGAQPWPAWIAAQWVHFVRNFTLPGALAALCSATVLVTALGPSRPDPLRARFPLRGDLAVAVGLTGLHGVLYVLLLTNAAWHHDYWQFFLGPFVAASLAAFAATAGEATAARAPRLAGVALAALLLLPLPWLATSLAFYARQRQPNADYAEALIRLRELVPPRVPAWTSRRPRTASETLGGYTRSWPNPVVAYYADRPLLYSRDAAEVEANRPGCGAYLLTPNRQPWARELDAALARSHERLPAGGGHVIFLLRR
jgi:4-amino-4-deoxy-L-arabinose transferase-like glycosyltransferase